jgi:hypothetical protein
MTTSVVHAPVPLELHEKSRIRAAAHHARRVIPGPLGELAHRELTSFAEFGYQFGPGSFMEQLIAQVTKMTGSTDSVP